MDEQTVKSNTCTTTLSREIAFNMQGTYLGFATKVSSVNPRPSWPQLLLPQLNTWPVSVTATQCLCPQAITSTTCVANTSTTPASTSDQSSGSEHYDLLNVTLVQVNQHQ